MWFKFVLGSFDVLWFKYIMIVSYIMVILIYYGRVFIVKSWIIFLYSIMGLVLIYWFLGFEFEYCKDFFLWIYSDYILKVDFFLKNYFFIIVMYF